MSNWFEYYQLAKKYYEHYGNLEVPLKFKTINGYEFDEYGINLGMWVQTQRRSFIGKSTIKISESQISKLREIGMRFEPLNNEKKWNKIFDLAKKYYKHYGNLEVPLKFKTINGYEFDEYGINLGMWIQVQRLNMKKRKLSLEQEKMLLQIGMKFEKGDNYHSDIIKDNLEINTEIDKRFEELKSNKKLMFLLMNKIKEKKFVDNDTVYDFMEKIFSDNVPVVLSEYIYNYLYKKTGSIKLDLNYKNNNIYLTEYYNRMISYYNYLSVSHSLIETNNKIGDIKRTTVKIKFNKKNIESLKTVSYALDSSVDLIVLNTDKTIYNSNTDINNIINKELKQKKYVKIGFIDEKKYPVYKTIELKEKNLETNSYLDDDILKQANNEYHIPKNISNYNKKTLQYLNDFKIKYRDYYNNFLLNNEYDIDYNKNLNNFYYKDEFVNKYVLTDTDISKFMKDLNENSSSIENYENKSRRSK